MLIITIINTGVSILFIVWCIRSLKRGNGLMSLLLPLTYMIFNGLGIILNQYSGDLRNYIITDDAVIKSVGGNLLFICISILVVRLYKINRQRPINNVKYNVNGLLVAFFAIVIIAAEARYLFLGGGIQRVYAIAQISDRNSAYAARYDESLSVGEGQGKFTAQICSKVFFPVVLLASLYLFVINRKTKFIILIILSSVFSFITAISSIQRSPGIVTIFTIVTAVIWVNMIKNNQTQLNILSIKNALLAFIGILFGGLVYSFTEDVDIYDGIYHLFERSMFITSFSATIYYDLFGVHVPFQGVGNLTGFAATSDSGAMTYGDIGYLATRYVHTLNANFIATSYAALGYVGVFLISIIILSICRYMDNLISKYCSYQDRFAIIVINITVFFELSNGPLMNGIASGFISNILLYRLMFHQKLKWGTS